MIARPIFVFLVQSLGDGVSIYFDSCGARPSYYFGSPGRTRAKLFLPACISSPSQFLPKAGNMFGSDEFQKIASKPWRACWRRVCSVPCECAQTERQISCSLGEILPSSQVSIVLFLPSEIEKGKDYFPIECNGRTVLTFKKDAINDDIR